MGFHPQVSDGDLVTATSGGDCHEMYNFGKAPNFVEW